MKFLSNAISRYQILKQTERGVFRHHIRRVRSRKSVIALCGHFFRPKMTSKMLFLLAMGLGIAASDDAIGLSKTPDEFILSCYITRGGLANRHFNVEAYEPGLCTHIYYGKLDLDANFTLMMAADDVTEGNKTGFYERINNLKLKQPGLKTVLTVGGMMPIDDVNFTHDNFAAFLSDAPTRKKIGTRMVKWAKKNNFDGLHINWTPDLMECNKNYTAFLEELKSAGGKDFILTAALRNRYDYVLDRKCDEGYNEVFKWGKILDFAHVTTFSYGGPWENRTDFNAPLNFPFALPHEDNVKMDMQSYTRTEFPREKLLLSIPSFAYGWHLLNASEAGVYATGTPSKPKPSTHGDGYAAYFEICPQKPAHQSTQFWSDFYDVPYSVDKWGDWWTHENKRSVELKMQLVKEKGYGGAIMYSLDFDDYDGACSGQTFELTKAMRSGLAYVPPTVEPTTTTPDPTVSDFILPCYITHEGLHRPEAPFLPESYYIPGLCTHVFYGFAVLDANFELLPNKEDLTVGNKTGDYVRINNLKLKQPGLKTVLSIGGIDEAIFTKHNFKTMIDNAELRKRFIASVMDTVNEYNFDGVDMYLTPDKIECNRNYSSFLRELKTAAGDLIVVAALRNRLGYHDFCNDDPYRYNDLEAWGKILDFAHIATFNYYGPWENETNFNSPLKTLFPGHSAGTVDEDMHDYTRKIPRKKLLLSIPAFANGWLLLDNNQTGMFSPGVPSMPKRYTSKAGFAAFYEICPHEYSLTKDFWNDMCEVPYTVDFFGQWFSYENKRSVELKMQYVKGGALTWSPDNIDSFGGAVIYSLDLDDFVGFCSEDKKPFALTRAMRSGLADVTTTVKPSTTPTTTTKAPTTTTTTQKPTTTRKPTTTTKAPTTTTTTSPPKPTPPATTPRPAFKCPEAFGSFSNPYDCRTYYKCWFWGSTLQWCPSYYYWDQRYKSCVWYTYAMCFLKDAPEQHKVEPEWLKLINV
uniref:Glyco_18 domain-containing protein n=1 Tax=Panagrellus redivivus TaxID=6233 RepID=A0A7E4UPD8_PANRE